MNPIRTERSVKSPMRSIHSLPLAALTLPILVTLGACSSDGTNDVTSEPGTPTVNAARVSRGTLADSAGVSVNGTSYSTDSTNFTNDGLPASRDSLSPGMQVTVLSDGTNAVSVEYDESVRGPIDVINLDGSSSVLGQTVTVSPDTIYALPSGHVLAAGDVVEVSGLRTADGSIAATWIGLEDAVADEYEVEGVVSFLDTTARTFMISGLTVDYGSALLDGFAGGAPKDGDTVEVEDSAQLYEPGSMRLVATEVELDSLDDELDSDHDDDDLDDDNGDDDGGNDDMDNDDHDDGDYEIEALITAIDGNGGFTLGNVSVRVSTTTVFENGDANGIVLDARVEVEGVLAADGVLDAQKIEFER